MGRLEDLRINAYLSEVARGYRNNAFVADVLFPTIYSEKRKLIFFNLTKKRSISTILKELFVLTQMLFHRRDFQNILRP